MGYLDNSTITVDAILTKKGRELLARGRNEFQISQFALADDEVDYNLWDTAHPNGSNYYGAVIENMPLLEAFVDENQLMRYKLTTLPKETAKLPILELPSPSLNFKGAGITQTVTPNTRNGGDMDYTFTLFNADVANLTVVGSGRPAKRRLPARGPSGETVSIFREEGPMQEATTPIFLNEQERKRSITLVGKSCRVISRSLTTLTNTNLSVTGNQTGAQFTISVSVQADPSKV